MAGLTSIREVAALFSPHGQYSKAGKFCLLGVVTQPIDCRLIVLVVCNNITFEETR